MIHNTNFHFFLFYEANIRFPHHMYFERISFAFPCIFNIYLRKKD